MESINQMKGTADQIRRKTKKLLAFTIMTVAASAWATTGKAQTYAEWFNQKNTQKKYLLQQIAALQAYAMYYKHGNIIAHLGLSSISGSLATENGLHTSYYNNLRNVNLLVRKNKQISDIVQWQQDILTRMDQIGQTTLSANEKVYIAQVKAALLDDCKDQMSQLQNVVENNKLKMSDEERLSHIAMIHKAMQNNYRFASTFTDQVKVYELQQAKENKDIATETKIYGIK